MIVTGKHIIGDIQNFSSTETFKAVNPANGKTMEPRFMEATSADVEAAATLAHKAFLSYRFADIEHRREFLYQIADEIEALGQSLVDRATAETALPEARISAEKKRTTGQLRLFADMLIKRHWLDLRMDTASLGRKPLAKPEIRSMNIPLGPVAVFGACNFPLAFSVAGGDTASALAAGCPVVVKAHPAHPGTSELVGQAIAKALKKCILPEGTFTLLQGKQNQVGAALVQHPCIKAVGFTGSYQGGKALFDLAAARTEPIPVFAEMGSVNPIFILPGALQDNAEKIAQGLVDSIVLGVGQFCTKPGLVIFTEDEASDAFIDSVKLAIDQATLHPMLNKGIWENYCQKISRLNDQENVVCLNERYNSAWNNCEAKARVYRTDLQTFLKENTLEEEVFGPSSLLVVCSSQAEMLTVAEKLKGQLTASLHANERDYADGKKLVDILQEKVGRIIFNGFPTGVEVCDAMVHGGPFPATTDARFTSVGTKAIERFLRPIAFQDFPQSLLPEALKDSSDSLIKMVDCK